VSVLKATLICRHPSNHLAYPLLAYGTIRWYDYIFGTFALQIICTWLYNGGGASVLSAMIAHLVLESPDCNGQTAVQHC
jgi:hypothetical protein